MFDLLRTLTINQVTGAFDQSFWNRDMLQAAQISPAIWHGGLALSAMHHRMKMVASTRPLDQQTAEDYYTLALKQYNTSIKHLVDIAGREKLSYADKETMLLASMLFTGICCLQRNFSQAVLHIQNAVELFHQWQFWKLAEQQGSRRSQAIMHPTALVQLVTSFQYQLADIGCSSETALKRQKEMTPIISLKPFESASDAYHEYVHLHFGAVIIPEKMEPNGLPTNPVWDQSLVYKFCWQRWKEKFVEYEKSGNKSPADMEGVRVLRVLLDCEETCHAVFKERTPEHWAKHVHKLERSVDAVEDLLEEQAKAAGGYEAASPVFTFSLSICEALRMVGLINRNGRVRRRVIELLQKWPRRDGILDGQLSRFFVEVKMMFEEKNMQKPLPPDWGIPCNCVEDVFICLGHRLRDVNFDFVGDDAVTFRVASEVDFRRGEITEYYTFIWDR